MRTNRFFFLTIEGKKTVNVEDNFDSQRVAELQERLQTYQREQKEAES